MISIDVVHALAAPGVRGAIDDFGTGHSSLADLERFPAHLLEIDKTFIIDGLGNDPQDTAIVAATLTLASARHAHPSPTVSNSRSNQDQLRRIGCDGDRGYLFARPPRPTTSLLGRATVTRTLAQIEY